MPREISGLRIARSYISPTDTVVSRVIDFQLGARQGIAIAAVLGAIWPDTGMSVSSAAVAFQHGVQTLHLESGSLETVPDAPGEDEDTIDSEIFYRQDLTFAGNDDTTTEFRSSTAMLATPNGVVDFEKPILTARNISHRGIALQSTIDFGAHVIIYYTFVEFSLSELGLILARRT